MLTSWPAKDTSSAVGTSRLRPKAVLIRFETLVSQRLPSWVRWQRQGWRCENRELHLQCTSTCPLWAVDSTGRRNTLSHSFCCGLNPKVLRTLPAIQSPRFLCRSEASKNVLDVSSYKSHLCRWCRDLLNISCRAVAQKTRRGKSPSPRSSMSALGQKATFAVQQGLSALPPKTDI